MEFTLYVSRPLPPTHVGVRMHVFFKAYYGSINIKLAQINWGEVCFVPVLILMICGVCFTR